MRPGPRLLCAAVLTALAGAAGGIPTAAPAHAAACAEGAGVTVVVDFASLGGGTSTGCAPGDPSSGVEALRGAGHEPTRAAQQPGYFVCRIDGKPASDPCQRASPANAYWSYWHAQPGGSWTFSNTGAADFDPKPGTVEGWAFGDGKPPSTPPPRPAPTESEPSSKPAQSPSQAPKPAAAPARTTSASAPPAPRATPASNAPAAQVAPAPTLSAAATAADPTATPTATTTEDATPSPTDEPVSLPDDRDDDGAPLGAVLALLLLALLAAGAAAQLRARRSSGPVV